MPDISKFDHLASVYAASRPTYPAEMYAAIEELSGVALAGARVADIGAGTGIAARQLRDRGASVTAVELSAGMLGKLVADSEGVAAVQGSANAIPLRDAAVDLVTFGQAWHWVDPELAVPEVVRVLRPGGALACFWNMPVVSAEWRRGYEERMRAVIGGEPDYGNSSTAFDRETRLDLGSFANLSVRVAEMAWSRQITIEERLTNIQSRSYIGELPPERREPFLANERAILEERFPDGRLIEEYTTWLGVVTV